MKLLGYHNGKQVVASMARHDYIGIDDIMMDGSQPNIGGYAGYNKFRGKPIWFEVAQTFAELFNDWNKSLVEPRKYGIWNLDEVKILSPEEIPDTESFEWRAENAIWGTNGIDGDLPTTYVHLKDCSKEHLEKIIELCKARNAKDVLQYAEYWLNQK